MTDCAVSLVINVAPADVGMIEHTLPHQLRRLRADVAEVLLAADLAPPVGRFAEDWPRRRRALEAWLADQHQVRVIEVDYSAAARADVRERLGLSRWLPARDWRGGPAHAYWYALCAATHDAVLHLDADMLLGGAGQGWTAQALRIIDTHADVFSVSPLPGPPTADGALRSQTSRRDARWPGAHVFDSFSTRVFLLRRDHLRERLGGLAARFDRAHMLAALSRRRLPWVLPEVAVTRAMRARGLCRVDLPGDGVALWSLHPPYRGAAFLAALPGLVARIEANDLPEAQRGDHDLNDALFDWREARAALAARSRKRRWLRAMGLNEKTLGANAPGDQP
jgi:hypothetical protein